MKMKKSILSCLMALGCLTASAQTAEPKTEYVFNPHFYVQAQVGGQYTLGEVDFGDLLSPNFQLAGGYQFHPIIGARLAINGMWSKAGSDLSSIGLKKYTWGWNYLAPSVDVTFNLSNLICGYNPTRQFSVSAFAGLGLNIGWGNDEAADASKAIAAVTGGATPMRPNPKENVDYLWDGSMVRLFGRAGVSVDYRINDQFSVGLELNANTLNDKYNSKRAQNADWYFNALVGVKYNLGPTHTTRTIAPPEPEIRYVDRVVEKVVEKIVEVPAAPATPKVEPLRREIFFAINSSKISAKEAVKVKDVAEYLNKYPEAKVEIAGYADAGTGNNAINDRLSAQRAAAVVNALKTQYKISADRIISGSKGSRVQPFTVNDKNRVVICIAE